MVKPDRRHRWFYPHSLSIICTSILILWVCLYIFSNPASHLGSFFGNAIADWSGVVVMLLATKYLYEKGSAESRRLPKSPLRPALELLRDHSLSVFLLITGAGWVVLFAHMDTGSRWGQVVGNVVSEWTQIFGVVIFTKRFIERHSRESTR
jgi:putative Mn2+ efflux pump MntP